MGLDKLRTVTPRRPGVTWFDMINSDFRQSPETRRFNYNFTYREHAVVDSISITSCVRISTKKGVSPQYMVELNFLPPGGGGKKSRPLTIFETNPNNYDGGWPEVEKTVDRIFAGQAEDLKNTRMDLNAETTHASVQYFRTTLRLPLKRTDSREGKDLDPEGKTEWWRAGIETLRYGKPPNQLQIYDKIQELKFKQAEYVSKLPDTLTRLEFRMGGIRCPIEKFTDIPKKLNDHCPFQKLQIRECPEYYDYKVDLHGSLARKLFNALRDDVGAQQATKYLNHDRNFSRQYKSFLIDNTELRREIEESYFRSNTRLLSGRGTSVRHQYACCSWCLAETELTVCQGCGVRLCAGCLELEEGHERNCLQKEEVN